MEKPSQPYIRDLDFRGIVEGLTYIDKKAQPLCHYFGGIPYALPPVGPFRWQKPRPLPPCYRYGTHANPGVFTGACGVCPQSQWWTQPNDGSLFDENCLQVNIWIPAGDSPRAGWPVLFWIHGGFLQFGNANDLDARALLNETACKAIIVTPGHRLNLFGFLASSELRDSSPGYAANVGFWDQRKALEWTWQNISYFGGDPSSITIGGYSAGSHSTFHQLAYDLGVSDSKSIVRRALMLSNGPGLQPKSFEEAQLQFNEFLEALQIPLDTSASEKLAKLHTLDAKTLIKAVEKMKYHEFRATTDGEFVRHGLMNEIDNGTFARQMKRRGVKLIMGECRDEHFVYGSWRPPKNSFEGLFRRLQADYPLADCKALVEYYYPNQKLPAGCKDWPDAFGRIYADIQIHHLERGFANALVRHGAGNLIFRYRIEWRAQCCDQMFPKVWGVTHGTDMVIWLWGSGLQLSKKEKVIAKNSFIDNLAKFLNGEELDWGTKHPLGIRTLTPGGKVVCEVDNRMEESLRVWEILRRARATNLPISASL
ncbi:paraben-hydrolyzing esterase precursor [Pleomassaria siparia CBS 279.74]|uniref:Carboxylic ester hydrolase n=1 Tax=Pleomassaria siparia CBS 279.74 TaxID=1314801 RepID=A0A6G1JZW8_9PLEO|nr:paraben-hydrolyzing esterase precursor [Pleomassaria siparia CBS 279.74]